MFKSHRSFTSGFTLIELLVVIAILATLTGLVATNFANTQGKARDARRKSDLTQIQRSLELFYNDHGQYPHESANQIAGCGAASQSVCVWGTAFQDATGTIYMETIPKDPKTSYVYYYNVDTTNYLRYQIFARLENTNDPILDRTGDGVADNYSQNCGGGSCNYAATSPNTDGTASF
ncbi:MAG: prepilin-type N-terminal cleavage/methylation domain-containing protein [Patescibacteria group bacterium]